MKIESVQAYPVRVKMREELRAGTFSYPDYQTVLVKATCDGVTGWGEAMTRFDPAATALLVGYFAKRLEGMDVAGPRDAWERVWKELRVRGHTRGTDVEALSGVEIALYDCLGKLEGEPVARLLAPNAALEAEVYSGSLFGSRGALSEQVSFAKEAGMKGAKVKVGFGVAEDVRTLKEVRDEWPDGMLVADANGAYDRKVATEACRSFSGLGLAWFEEPVLSDDWEGYMMLRGSGVPIGAGESWFAGDFAWAVRQKVVDVLEPSVSRCGGIGVVWGAATAGVKNGMRFSPMTGMNSAVSLAASLQLAAAVQSAGAEMNPFPNPLVSELADGIPAPRNGSVVLSGRPGLGIEVDESFVKRNVG